jgi:hypothetical protein
LSIEKKKVFMIMPFEDAFFEIFEMLRREFEDEFDFSHAGEEDNQHNILKDIIQPIYEADIIVADLTGLNPNVLYELAVAHTFNKKTIVITQDDLGQLPFDLKQYRAKNYSTHFKKFAELLEDMKRNLLGAVSGDVVYSNPVKDFLTQNKIDSVSWFSDEKISIGIDGSEKGFLDFLAGIEENTEMLTQNISDMISEMETMTEGVKKSSTDIENVNKTGGSGSASFVRKEAKKVAGYMNTFSAKLKTHNIEFVNCWNGVEKDILGLLESDISNKDKNKEHIISYMKALKALQLNITTSKESIISMKESSLGNIGVERTLNQAIRFLDEDLHTYVGVLDSMLTSVDKIIGKSKFVVGEIDFSAIEGESEE